MEKQVNYELFVTDMGPNGTNDLIIINKDTNDVVDTLSEACFSANQKLGDNAGVYAETCGGYAGQIHTAVYLDYDGERVMYASNLEPYEGCDHEYDENCEQCNWDEIDFLDSIHGEYKLFWIDIDAAIKYAACSPVCQDGQGRVVEFLSKYIAKDELQEYIDMLEYRIYGS